YRFMAPLNRSGPTLLRSLAEPRRLDVETLERAMVDGVALVDGRDRLAFAQAHVPGSINIELDEQFASYLGWILPWNAPVALVLPEPEAEALEEALTQARRIGFDRVLGYLEGGVQAWTAAGRPAATYPTAATDDLCAALAGGAHPRVLDVRQPNEWAQGVLPGSITVFVGDLPERAAEVPADEELGITCRTGPRSAIAAS